MQTDGGNIKADMTAKEKIKQLTKISDVLWAIMGLKLALDKLNEVKVEALVAPQETLHEAKITVNFGELKVDLVSCTVNGKALFETLESLTKQLTQLEKEMKSKSG